MFHFVSLLLVVVLVGVMDVMTQRTDVTVEPGKKYQFNNPNYPDGDDKLTLLLVLNSSYPIKLNCSVLSGISNMYCKNLKFTVYDTNNIRSFCHGPFQLVTETNNVTLSYHKIANAMKLTFFCEYETKHQTCTFKEFFIDFFIKKSMKCLKQ